MWWLRRAFTMAVLLICVVFSGHAQTQAVSDQTVALEPGELADGIQAIARLYDMNILVATELLEGRTHGAIRGEMNLDDALGRLLAGQGLEAQLIDRTSIAIVAQQRAEIPPALPAPLPSTRNPLAWQLTVPAKPELETTRFEDAIIVTGTRTRNRTVFEALAPIDVISADELRQSASDELLDGLAQSLPTFTALRLPLNDGNIFNRPTALRGLSSDQTLVLVDGKRRHRSAFLETTNGQAIDLAQIPITAISRVEVLRDGASAQYGSDAIGGVINIILAEETTTSAFAQQGQYFEGDGEAWRAGLRTGLSSTGGDFITLGAEAFHSAPTSRSVQREDAIAFQAANPEIDLPNPVQRWGQPEREGWRVSLNTAYAVRPETELYSFATFGLTQGMSDFNWRNPDVSSAYLPSHAFPDFDLSDVYPAGFTPRFGQEETDYSLFAGIRNEGADGILWDASLGFGENEIDYILNNSINASLGPESPRDFRPGRLSQTEMVLNLDGSKQFGSSSLAEKTYLSFGGEYRHEMYEIEAGDPASYLVGPGARDGLPAGSNGFPGYTPEQADRFSQSSFAVYADVEFDLNNDLTVGFATRYEDYSLFGDTLNGKVSFRYSVTPDLAVRGTASTGFRAPTAGQVFSQRTSQGLDSTTLDSLTRGRFSPESVVAEIISRRNGVEIRSLSAEESVNLTAGLVFRSEAGLTFSLDAYQIEIDDAFGRSPNYELTEGEWREIQERSPELNRVENAYFFQNAYDQILRGVDVVASGDWNLGHGIVSTTLAYSFNDKTRTASRLDPDWFEGQILTDPHLDESLTLTATYKIGDFEFYSRLRAHGEWTGASGIEDDPIQVFGARSFLDLAVQWEMNDSTSIKLGAENVADTYPDPARNQSNRGLIYSRDSPYDTDGGLFYLRLTNSF